MSAVISEIGGERALVCAAEGPPIATERDAADIVGEALGAGARLIVLPLTRLTPDFLDLKTRLAGEILQKFVNYRRRVAILGDVSEAAAGSKALADFVRESNRGSSVWFVRDLPELEVRLA